jgi:hypothetical protein
VTIRDFENAVMGRMSFLRSPRFNAWAFITWVVVGTPVSLALGHLTLYVTAISVYTIWISHAQMWQASKMDEESPFTSTTEEK